MKPEIRGICGARVVVTDVSGKSYTAEVLIPSGEGEKRLSKDELIKKSIGCAVGVINSKNVSALVDKILGNEIYESSFKYPMAGMNPEMLSF